MNAALRLWSPQDASDPLPLPRFCRPLPVTFETYIIPCVAWSWYYRTQERREHAVIKP